MTKSEVSTSRVDASPPVDSSSSINASTGNITVEVSGSRFCIVPSLFKHIENLQWKKRNNKTLKLNANPDVFESVLKFFLSAKLPDRESLSTRRAKTLIDFVSPLNSVEVKPFVDYLQSFLVEKAATAETSFVRRNFTNFSLPFTSRGVDNKTKVSNEDSIEITAVQSNCLPSINNNISQNTGNHISNRECSETNVPTTQNLSIPTHIEHPVTTSTMVAEISVCSLDESSVSKLSLQSSPSLGMTMPQDPQNENSLPVLPTVSIRKYRPLSYHLQSQYEYHSQYYYQQNALNKPILSDPGLTIEKNTHKKPHLETPSHIKCRYHPKSEPLGQFAMENRQYEPQRANNCVPFTKTHNFMSDATYDKNNQIFVKNQSNPSQNDKTRVTKRFIRTVLGGNEKRNTGNETDASNGDGRKLFWRQRMTHADWCASEYVV